MPLAMAVIGRNAPTWAKRLSAVLNHFLQLAFADHGAAAHFGTAEPPLGEPCVNGVRRDAAQVGRRLLDRKESIFAHKSTSHPVIAEIRLDITVLACNSQYMQSHYAITITIRYYKGAYEVGLLPGPHPRLRVTLASRGGAPFDVSTWKDEPHIALANLRDDPKAVLWFTRTYGVLAWGKRKTISVRGALNYRDLLRRAWEGDGELNWMGPYNFFALPSVKDIWLIAQPTGMIITVNALWPLIQFLFSRDWAEKRIRKCENPDCPAPYFRAVRKGQRFCSQRCGVLINVRRFRERAAKTGKRKNSRGRG